MKLNAIPVIIAILALTASARADVTAHATRVGSAPAAQQLDLVLPLVADTAGLQRFAEAVTAIGSPEYGQYESVSRLAARFGAGPATRARVLRLLRAAGARSVSVNGTGLFVSATFTVARAERLFGTALARYQIARSTRFTAPTGAASIPASLRGLVTGVIGLDTQPVFQAPPVQRASAAVLARAAASARTTTAGRHGESSVAHAAQASTPSGYQCGGSTPCLGTQSGCAGATQSGGFTPNEILNAYGYDTPPVSTVQGQGERVALIEIDGFNPRDIDTFAKCFGLAVPAINVWDANGDLGSALPPGGETTLDLEVLDAVAPKLKAIDVYESDADARDALTALTAPLTSGDTPQVISASIGDCEQSNEQVVGERFLNAAEAVIEEAAASGITFVSSAGDSGSTACTNGVGTPTKPLSVSYPASSPWITSVGGTNFTLGAQNQITNEVVWNDGALSPGAAGGGGFSSLWKTPPYQSDILSAVDANSRAVPDVSMLADILPGYAIYCTASDCAGPGEPAGGWQEVGGTSAGTPLLGAGFALVDQLLTASGKQALGLANPLLYKLGAEQYATPSTLSTPVFNDITEGSNDVGPFVRDLGLAPLGCCTAGVGYDEASGLGSVNLAAFADQALATQPALVTISARVPAAQRPVHAKRILATVTCSGTCQAGAVVSVYVGHKNVFTDYSALDTLKQAGSATVSIPFSDKQLSLTKQLATLKAALADHQTITAFVRGAIVDPLGKAERETVAIKLTIRS